MKATISQRLALWSTAASLALLLQACGLAAALNGAGGGGNGRKSGSNVKKLQHNANTNENRNNNNNNYAELWEREEQAPISFYSNTRSVNQNNDACQLNIECSNSRVTQLKLPIFGPKGDQGPPGAPGLRGEKGEPGHAGIPAREPPPPNFSAFFAGLANNTGPFTQDTNVVFTEVLTNYGESYDDSTGVYTAPYNGVYQFLITVSATGKQKAGVMLMKNGKSVLTVWSESDPWWSTSTQTIILRLAMNDRVNIRVQARASHLHGYMYSSFGGSLLYEEMNSN